MNNDEYISIINQLIEKKKSILYANSKEKIQNKAIRNFFTNKTLDFKPNLLITLNARRLYGNNTHENSKIETYNKLQRGVAVFIEKLAKDVLPPGVFAKKYEDWPRHFRFFAFFEDHNKDGNFCTPHFHIMLRVPERFTDYASNSQILRSRWLNHINSSDPKDFDFKKIARGDEKFVSQYASKQSANDDSINYSFTHEDLRKILKRG